MWKIEYKNQKLYELGLERDHSRFLVEETVL